MAGPSAASCLEPANRLADAGGFLLCGRTAPACRSAVPRSWDYFIQIMNSATGVVSEGNLPICASGFAEIPGPVQSSRISMMSAQGPPQI